MFNHLAAFLGNSTIGPLTSLQVGKDSIKKRPYYLLNNLRSSTTTIPRSNCVRITLPKPCRKVRMASVIEYSLNGSSKVSDRAATIGSDGTAKGNLTITNTDNASPGISTPSQNARVPNKTARSVSRKLSNNILADAPSPCSYTWISASAK